MDASAPILLNSDAAQQRCLGRVHGFRSKLNDLQYRFAIHVKSRDLSTSKSVHHDHITVDLKSICFAATACTCQ